MDKLQTLRHWISESKRIVFFGGAGVSTESGIPDFRSVDGLYSQKFDYPPEQIISLSFYLGNPEYFFRFYREKMLLLGHEPNITHKVLARWELPLLPRISMVCTKRQAVNVCMNCMAVCCGIIVSDAENFTVRSL